MKNTSFKIGSLLLLVFISMTLLQVNSYASKADSCRIFQKKIFFTIKYGQGGFNDSRSPIGQLGGGQLAITAQHANYPIALSISGEYYTNSAGASHPYEISDMTVFNCFYSKYFFKKNRLNIFVGLGLGTMVVPQTLDNSVRSLLFDIEAGVNAKLLWKFGLYASYKYLYANKSDKVDFSEHILLVGITFNFRL